MAFSGGGTYPGSNAIEIIPDTSVCADPWPPGLNDQAIWATEDEYSDTVSQSQSRAGSEPPGKKSRGDSQGNGSSSSKSKAIGKMFFKTKLCCKFRAGTCPYITNCNFAHGMEELRKPPPNWQEIVAAHEDTGSEPREEHQIPILTPSSLLLGEGQRTYKGRHCKKFYTDEGCPYGDSCTFMHDEQSKARESVAISLSPSMGGGPYGSGNSGPNLKPSNWKTRICNKWEMTGYCPFGSKCHFAHGAAELHRYGGGLVEADGRDASSVVPDLKQAGSSARMPMDTVVASNASVPHADAYHMGVPAQRSAVVSQRQGQRPPLKWKGPDKISRIYGDWIDEND